MDNKRIGETTIGEVKMSEAEDDNQKRWCYGKMDLYVTGDCSDCKDMAECWNISFEVEES